MCVRACVHAYVRPCALFELVGHQPLVVTFCECVSLCAADMAAYCSAHDEWLIMKLCMYRLRAHAQTAAVWKAIPG